MRLASRSPTAALITAVLNLCFFVRPLVAADCSVQTTDFGSSFGNTFNVTTSGFTNAEIQAAANYWSCPGYSGEIPTFQIGGSGGIPVSVVKRTGRSNTQNGGCGEGVLNISNGQVTSANIEIWTNQANGISCAPLTDVIAHELGHLLGLEEAQDPFGACFGHIMGGTVETQARTVYADDCSVADTQWETSTEGESSDPWCDAYCWTSCTGSYCPPRSDGSEGCPLLLDIENDGFRLTGLDDPVWFDIDADGQVDLMSWTDRGEAMLVLDRNGNGSIDDGSELFGDATRLANGTRAANGYLALAELDSWFFGGNGDGEIGPADAAFGSLRLWTDADHSGTSRPEELQTLDLAGIRSIGLQYRTSHRTDRYGNKFRFLGRAWQEGHQEGAMRPILTWDVFFTVIEAD